jgi:serine phosphatase RsbU (regulator of sigma subunit)
VQLAAPPDPFDPRPLERVLAWLGEASGGPCTWLPPETPDGEPVTAEGRLVGHLQAAHLDPSHRRAAAELLGWAAQRVLTQADLTRQGARLWRELTFFHRMGVQLDDLPDPVEAFPVLLGAIARQIPSAEGWLVLPEARGWQLAGPPPEDLWVLARALDVTTMGRAVATPDQLPDQLPAEARSRLAPHLPLLVATLVDQGAIAGVLALGAPTKEAYSSFAGKLLTAGAAMAMGVLRRERMLQQARAAAQMARELEVARGIQRTLLPAAPLELPELACWGWCREAAVVGGDMFGWWPGERHWLFLGDVSGHGVGAALYMSNAHAILRALCREHRDPAVVAAHLNDLLGEEISASGAYLTLALASYEPATRALRFVGLGHPPLVLLRAGATEPELLEGQGLPAGLFPGEAPGALDLTLAAGDLLVAYTDGITERERADGEPYGLERLQAAVVRHRDLAPAALGEAVVADVDAFAGEAVASDDQTLLVVRAG